MAQSRDIAARVKASKLELIVMALCVLGASSSSLEAQYIGDQMPGLAGLKAGSQPAPGIYVVLPLYYRYGGISINDAHGNLVSKRCDRCYQPVHAAGGPVVTPFKILGATYGAGFSQWVNNGIVEVAAAGPHDSTSYGYGDTHVQPLILGWHARHADVTTGYSFFAPTGSGTSGQHMWVHEIDLGITIYPDAAKKWNVATMSYYDFNRKKSTSDITVGNILTFTGGAGRSFFKGAANAGVAYAAQWKTTHDSGTDIPPRLPITNGRVFGVGPEISMPVFAKGQTVGLVSFRYLWLVGPKTALGGQTLMASFTVAKLRKQ